MIWYTPITIILSLVDAMRMKRVWAKVNNINHWLSYLLAAIGIVGLLFCTKGLPAGIVSFKTLLLYLLHITPFIIGCIAIRGMFYDMALNAFVNFFIIPRAIDYISVRSNSLNEDRLTNIPFWWRRVGYTGLLLIVLIINHFL